MLIPLVARMGFGVQPKFPSCLPAFPHYLARFWPNSGANGRFKRRFQERGVGLGLSRGFPPCNENAAGAGRGCLSLKTGLFIVGLFFPRNLGWTGRFGGDFSFGGCVRLGVKLVFPGIRGKNWFNLLIPNRVWDAGATHLG